jgi:hypothetical protein
VYSPVTLQSFPSQLPLLGRAERFIRDTIGPSQFVDPTGLVCITPQSIERGSTHGAIIAVGERFPAFILPNEHGEPFDLYAASLSKDPLMY